MYRWNNQDKLLTEIIDSKQQQFLDIVGFGTLGELNMKSGSDASRVERDPLTAQQFHINGHLLETPSCEGAVPNDTLTGVFLFVKITRTKQEYDFESIEDIQIPALEYNLEYETDYSFISLNSNNPNDGIVYEGDTLQLKEINQGRYFYHLQVGDEPYEVYGFLAGVITKTASGVVTNYNMVDSGLWQGYKPKISPQAVRGTRPDSVSRVTVSGGYIEIEELDAESLRGKFHSSMKASQVEAEAGVDGEKIMTPIRVKQAVVELTRAHNESDGSSHTFIDQDVTTTGNPTFKSVKVTETLGVGTSAPAESFHTVSIARADEGFVTGDFIIRYNPDTECLEFSVR
jgi:hypothetical protein